MIRRMIEAFLKYWESIDQTTFDIEVSGVPLFLREVDDSLEDPALTSARNAYQMHLESLKSRMTPEALLNFRSKVTKMRKRG